MEALQFVHADRVAILSQLRQRGWLSGVVELGPMSLEDFFGLYLQFYERELCELHGDDLDLEVMAVRIDGSAGVVMPVPPELLQLLPTDAACDN